jgi:hypothetical protein
LSEEQIQARENQPGPGSATQKNTLSLACSTRSQLAR